MHGVFSFSLDAVIAGVGQVSELNGEVSKSVHSDVMEVVAALQVQYEALIQRHELLDGQFIKMWPRSFF